MASSVDISEVGRALRAAPDQLFAEWRKAFTRIFAEFQTHHTRARFQNQTSAKGLKSRTGNLRRSFTIQITGTDIHSLVGQYGSNLIYAGTHEFGAEITPKRVKYLTIPFGHGLTAAGVSRRPARGWQPSFITPSRRNPQNLILWWSGADPPVPVMVLTKGPVEIPPRLGLAEEWEGFQPRIVELLNAATAQALAR